METGLIYPVTRKLLISINMTNSSALQLSKVVVWDFVVLAVIYLVPTLSHVLSFPLYLLDPFRLCVLGSLMFLNNKKNAYFLALTLPLFSFIIASHPVMYKNIIIGIELVTNIYLLQLFAKKYNVFIATLASIIFSKVLYYALKFFAIETGLITTGLVDTAIWIQLIIAFMIALLFSIVYKRRDFHV